MLVAALSLVAALPFGLASRVKLDPKTHRELVLNGRQQIPLWQALLKDAKIKAEIDMGSGDVQHTFAAAPDSRFGPHCFEQPMSHFDESVNSTFCQRYWMDASMYEEGGPVFVLDGGEIDAETRIPFLETGILQILSNATKGLSIVLEHRYYGESIPVETLSTDNLRFLNNAEALEDSAEFIRHFSPPASALSLNSPDQLSPQKTPWIYYGGSYAGARAAHMRTQYPDIVYGAIASSGVVHSQVSFPEYHDPIQKYGPADCIANVQSAIKTIDVLLEMPEPIPSIVKGLFGLGKLSDNGDFGRVLSEPLGSWQAQNWNPSVSTNAFVEFCEAMTAGGASSQIGLLRIPAEVMNYASYVKKHIVSQCPTDDVEDCFGSQDDERFRDTSPDQVWRLWLFQVCTQWGYFQHAPEEGPSIISKFIDLAYTSKTCRQAFPPGEHFKVPVWPDVDEINRRGDYGIAIDRLALIDGDRDPWRPATAQSDVAARRKSTAKRPAQIIFNAIHHYDENGISDHSREPARIKDVHAFEINFVQEWLAEWAEAKRAKQ